MRRPNTEYQVGIMNDYEHNGNNDFNTKFLHIYDALLDFSYQSITENGRYFNKYDKNDRNLCYVPEKDFEKPLDKFMSVPSDGMRILVGFTGIGKTTLLKNYFGIKGRNPIIDKNGKLIAYKSFHSERLNSENYQYAVSKIDTIISSYVSSIIDCLYPEINYDELDWQEFADYIKDIKRDVMNRSSKVPGYRYDVYCELQKLEKEDPFEYYSCLLKYIMKKHNINKDLVLIFDDIESVNLKFHIPILEKIFAFNTCLSYNKNRDYSIKIIIAMRGYTFRYNLFRQGEANRIAEEDIIIKNDIPDLLEMIKRRFEVIEDNPDIMKKITSMASWNEAKKELLNHIYILDLYYKNMLTGLTHNNISRTAKLLFKIATNNRWLCYKSRLDSSGSFIAKSEHYNILNKEAIMKALIYGEDNVYIDYDNNILPNILHSHYEKMPKCELLGLYILNYYQRTNICHNKQKLLYGNTKIKGIDAVNEIKEALNKSQDLRFSRKIEYMISFLYRQGLLLHSIFEPEVLNNDTQAHERVYDSNYGLYISLRAITILNMLEKSSIVLEFYRDDIDTELLNNNQLSAALSQTDKFIYNIKYLEKLFQCEKQYISEALTNIERYTHCFGYNFVISKIVYSILISFRKYYGKKDEDYFEVYDMLNKLMKDCLEYEEKIDKAIYFDDSIKELWHELCEEREKYDILS